MAKKNSKKKNKQNARDIIAEANQRFLKRLQDSLERNEIPLKPPASPLGEEHHRGAVVLRGSQVPEDSTTGNLLAEDPTTNWQQADPWRVLRIQAEFVDGFEAMSEVGPAIAIFGSARTDSTDEYYEAASEVAGRLANQGVSVITGGGPGIMEAANRGASLADGKSVGLGIELPHEQALNPWVNIGIPFRYFFVRKTMFVKYSQGAIFFPGGFGTLDEMFEVLVLAQTHKIGRYPIVLFGSEYWAGLMEWINATLKQNNLIDDADTNLFTITDSPEEAVALVTSKQ